MFGVIKLSTSEQHSRKAHTKSRNGCRVCKERKLKCDETKPVCGPCSRRFVTIESCDYTPHPKAKLKPNPEVEAQSHAQPPAQGPAEVQPHLRSAVTRDRSLAPVPFLNPQLCSASEYSTSSASAEPLQFQREASRSGSPPKGVDRRFALPSSLRAELFDPFVTYPESKVKGVDLLLRYYLQTAVYKSFPWQPASTTNPTTTYFVPLVLTDTVLFHATLQLSVLRCKRKAAEWLGVNLTYLQAECIRLLRERVENDASCKRVCDQTVSAVAALAAYEHERGNVKMLRMHMSGLRRMVEIRGGLNSIRQTNPMAANSVFWIFVVAMYEVPYPAFDRTLPPFAPHDHNLRLSSPEPQDVVSHFSDMDPHAAATISMNVDFSALGLVNTIASVLASIQHVSHLVPTNAAYPTASTSLVILTRMCTLLSHLLSLSRADLTLPVASPDTTLDTEKESLKFSGLISECTRLALLMHVFTPWRGLPPDATLSITLLLHQQIAALRELILHPSFASNNLTLWIFCAGGVAASGMPERKWFIGHLVQLTEELGICDWETCSGYLRKVVWHENLCGRTYRVLWEEVDGKRRELGENFKLD